MPSISSKEQNKRQRKGNGTPDSVAKKANTGSGSSLSATVLKKQKEKEKMEKEIFKDRDELLDKFRKMADHIAFNDPKFLKDIGINEDNVLEESFGSNSSFEMDTNDQQEEFNNAILDDNQKEIEDLRKKQYDLEKQSEEVANRIFELGGTIAKEDNIDSISINKRATTTIENGISEQSEKRTMFKYVVRLKITDLYSFSDLSQVMQEITDRKGNVHIDHAFFNHHNKLLYLCTNKEESFNKLTSTWPVSSFNKGVEIVQSKERAQRFFIAINGLPVSLDIENEKFKSICAGNNIFNAKRLMRKSKGTMLPTVKAEVQDKDSFDKLLKLGLKYGWFLFRVSAWKYDNTQPIQCHTCLKFGHLKIRAFQNKNVYFVLVTIASRIAKINQISNASTAVVPIPHVKRNAKLTKQLQLKDKII
jgi:hypothetical protein